MDMDQSGNPLELSAAEGGTLAIIQRAEIDQQIATAKRYPRSLAAFKKRAIEMATFDEDTAESCLYSRPVGKKKNDAGQWVESYAEGMSIRMAEIVGACFGNLRVGSMLIELDPAGRFVKARGVAHDLETNFFSTSEVVESTVGRDKQPYSERQRMVVAKAALSKARRDATFQVVPRALCRPIEVEARKVAIGDATTLAKRRAAVLAWVAKLGIDVRRVFAALDIQDEEGIGLDQLARLTGLKTAIKDGEVTVDEAFPNIDPNTGEVGTAIRRPQPKSASAPAPSQPDQQAHPEQQAQQQAGSAAGADRAPAEQARAEAPQATAAQAKPEPPAQGVTLISPGTLDTIRNMIKVKGLTEKEVCDAHQIADLSRISARMAMEVLGYLSNIQ